MYLLDDTHVVLLARDGCNWGTDAESQALVVEVKQGKPANAASLPVKGTIEESRLVGTALYVASSTYRKLVSTNTADGGPWERGTQISSFDLSQPNQPTARSTEWVSGNGLRRRGRRGSRRFPSLTLRRRKSWDRSSSSKEKRSSPRGSTATGFML